MVGNISISGVSKHFINPTGERITALDNVSLEIPSGSFVSLIGPSGCGKSTLLRLISGLIQMDEGELTLDGVPVTAPGADRGFMFQEHTLFPWLSIYDNIAFGLRARGIYKQEKDRVDEFIEMVGLKGFEHSYPHQLSGGMCQRASLARALVGRPKVLLLDEPLGALDAFTRMNMQDEILRIWKETGMTAIMVTHDVDEAVYLSDKVVVMTPRPGRITGTLDIQLSPAQQKATPAAHRLQQCLPTQGHIGNLVPRRQRLGRQGCHILQQRAGEGEGIHHLVPDGGDIRQPPRSHGIIQLWPQKSGGVQHLQIFAHTHPLIGARHARTVAHLGNRTAVQLIDNGAFAHVRHAHHHHAHRAAHATRLAARHLVAGQVFNGLEYLPRAAPCRNGRALHAVGLIIRLPLAGHGRIGKVGLVHHQYPRLAAQHGVEHGVSAGFGQAGIANFNHRIHAGKLILQKPLSLGHMAGIPVNLHTGS